MPLRPAPEGRNQAETSSSPGGIATLRDALDSLEDELAAEVATCGPAARDRAARGAAGQRPS